MERESWILVSGARVKAVVMKKGQNSWDQDSLVQAVRKGRDAILPIIGEDSSNINEVHPNGYTLLQIAVCEGSKDIVQFLFDRGASVDLKDHDYNAQHDYKDHDGNTLLHLAVGAGSIDVVKYLLDLGADVDATNGIGWCVLLVAVSAEQEDIVKLLMERGCRLDWKDCTDNTLLHQGAVIGNTGTFKLLLDQGRLDVNAVNKNGQTVLHIACDYGKVEIVKKLLESGVKLNEDGDINGDCELHSAVKRGNVNVTKLLLDRVSDVDLRGHNGMTALQIACEEGHEDLVRILVERGARVDAIDRTGNNTSHCAARSKNKNILELLMNFEIDINAKNFGDQTALHIARGQGNEEIVKFLVDCGARVNGWERPVWVDAVKKRYMNIVLLLLDYGLDVNSKTSEEKPLLHEVYVYDGYNETAASLIERGADINITDRDGDSILHRVADFALDEEDDFCEFLIERGCDVNMRNNSGQSALHCACDRDPTDTIDIVKIIVESGAEIEARDENGETPLLLACDSYGSDSTIRLLLDSGADVNASNSANKNVVELTLESNNVASVEIIVSHIVKMKSLKLPVSQTILDVIEKCEETRAFKTKCEKELESMKSHDSAFWRLLMSNHRCLGGFARNREMIRALKSDEYYDIRFPIYSGNLKEQMRRGIWRKTLLDKAQHFFTAVAEAKGNEYLPKLPRLCVEEIYSYFSDEDFRNLIKVCDPHRDFVLHLRHIDL